MSEVGRPRSAGSGSGVLGSVDGDEATVDALRAGNESAFRDLVRRHHQAMVRVAAAYLPSRSLAEEVVQETWLAVLEGLHRFEGRSSLKTWIFRILVNRAKTRGVREHRSLPLSSLDHAQGERAVDPARFLEEGHRWAGHWAAPPQSWSDMPAERLLGRETRQVVDEAIEVLPAQQRLVITLRDIEELTAEEVCALLHLSEGNQRVLLHRARSRVRAALEKHLEQGEQGQ